MKEEVVSTHKDFKCLVIKRNETSSRESRVVHQK